MDTAHRSAMFESFGAAFIIQFVVIDPVGNAAIFLAVACSQDRSRNIRTALEGTLVTAMIMLFFVLCGAWILAYLNISKAAFKIAGGIILFLVALTMLEAKRLARRKRSASTGNTALDGEGKRCSAGSNDRDSDHDNVAIYPLAILLLASPSTIMSVIVVTANFASSLGRMVTGYAALIAVMVATGIILCSDVVAETQIDKRISMVFSRITAIILADLSVQYIDVALAIIGFASLQRLTTCRQAL